MLKNNNWTDDKLMQVNLQYKAISKITGEKGVGKIFSRKGLQSCESWWIQVDTLFGQSIDCTAF